MKQEIIRLIDMPCTINGYTLIDENGDYNIYINSRLTLEGQHQALLHEREHLRDEDFYSSAPAKELEERVAHRLKRQCGPRSFITEQTK